METNTDQNPEVLEKVQPTTETNNEAEVHIDEGKLQRFMDNLKLEQNLLFGSLAGVVAMLVGAAIWAAITIALEWQIGWMAVAVGFLVGYAIRIAGKGIDKIFGIVGAILSLLGCILGNFFTLVGFVSIEEGLGFFETLTRIDYKLVPELMLQTGSPIDLLFYGIAIYEGYRFAFRKITEQELLANAV